MWLFSCLHYCLAFYFFLALLGAQANCADSLSSLVLTFFFSQFSSSFYWRVELQMETCTWTCSSLLYNLYSWSCLLTEQINLCILIHIYVYMYTCTDICEFRCMHTYTYINILPWICIFSNLNINFLQCSSTAWFNPVHVNQCPYSCWLVCTYHSDSDKDGSVI